MCVVSLHTIPLIELAQTVTAAAIVGNIDYMCGFCHLLDTKHISNVFIYIFCSHSTIDRLYRDVAPPLCSMWYNN